MKNIIYTTLLFCVIISCNMNSKRNPNLCEYFWLNGLDLEVGCIKLTNDVYKGDGFLPDHYAISEGTVDEKCEAELIAYLEKKRRLGIWSNRFFIKRFSYAS